MTERPTQGEVGVRIERGDGAEKQRRGRKEKWGLCGWVEQGAKHTGKRGLGGRNKREVQAGEMRSDISGKEGVRKEE